MAARKLNDMIAMTAVIEAVSSIGSSFPIEEVPVTRLRIVRGPGHRQYLLCCTAQFAETGP